jgi:selenide,water dikinase
MATVGMDCSIVPLSYCSGGQDPQQLVLVSTTDFFFPSVEDPYLQGQIGAANVVSDLCAVGVSSPDTVLMQLAASTDMEAAERKIVTREIMRGFNERVLAAGSRVTGGQSVFNPWPLIGGTAVACVPANRIVRPDGVRPGDILVLTKPIGFQLAVNLKQWTKRPTPLYKGKIEGHMSLSDIDTLYDAAALRMRRLNCAAARLMLKHGATGATDVTGFGLVGHAANLAAASSAAMEGAAAPGTAGAAGPSPCPSCDPTNATAATDARPRVSIRFDRVPVLRGALRADDLLDGKYNLRAGLSAETSGGLLIAFPSHAAAADFVAELLSCNGSNTTNNESTERTAPAVLDAGDLEEAWIVGAAVAPASEGDGDSATYAWASMADGAEFIEV